VLVMTSVQGPVPGESEVPAAGGEPQLGTGMRPFLADDQLHPRLPALEQVAVECGDPGAVQDPPVRLDGGRPGRRRNLQHSLVNGVGDVMPTEYDSRLPRCASQPTNSCVPPAESVRTCVVRPRRCCLGSRARAMRVAVM
jgi:hypothetical protein